MTFGIIEEKLYKSFLVVEKNDKINKSEKIKYKVINIENEFINNKDLMKTILIDLINNSDEVFNIAGRIVNKLVIYYKSRGIKIKNEEKSKFILARIIMYLSNELIILEKQSFLSKNDYKLLSRELLKSELEKMFYYLIEETQLAVLFEDYN
jgi:hypothetical protein